MPAVTAAPAPRIRASTFTPRHYPALQIVRFVLRALAYFMLAICLIMVVIVLALAASNSMGPTSDTAPANHTHPPDISIPNRRSTPIQLLIPPIRYARQRACIVTAAIAPAVHNNAFGTASAYDRTKRRSSVSWSVDRFECARTNDA
ncbi:MAG TPA: hypothetical protein DDZ51_02590 [Planctomycetaceae bacterium]|nr:hypothetical protein [Planctomycetaceae bacterium]